MSPEHKLLLLCARTKLTDQDSERIRALAGQELDWELLLQHAFYHKTFPLLYNSLKKACPDMVPEAVLQQLKSYYLKNAAHSFFLAGMLIKVLRILEQNNIPAVPFKGPVLSETIFGDTGLRSYCDLDIQVHQHDMYRAAQLLIEHGYQLDLKNNLDESQFNKLIQTDTEVQLYNEKNGVTIDLQWDLAGRYFSMPLDLTRMQGRLEQVVLLKHEMLQFSSEDLLVYLCIHANRHCWEQLDAVCCVNELIGARPGLDWHEAVRTAEQLGSKRMLFIGISLAHELLGTVLPAEITTRVAADKKINKMADQVREKMFQDRDAVGNSVVSQRFDLWNLISLDYRRDSLRYGLRLLTDPTKCEWNWIPLPANLAFLHYVLRPIRLMWELGVGLAGKVKR